MQNNFSRKGLVFIILVLFVGASVVSGINIQLKNTKIPDSSGRENTLNVDSSGNSATSGTVHFEITEEFICDAGGPYSGWVDEPVQFNGHAVGGFPPYSWHWDFGDGGKIHAVNPDGTEKWRYQTGYAITSDPAIGDDGTIYIGSGDKYLYAMNPNGTLKWRFKTGDEIHGHPAIGNDGTIYIGSYDDYFYAIYANGTMKWKFNSAWGTANSAAIADDGTIYVGTNKLYARNPDGSHKWTFNLGTDRYIGFSSPAISADGTIYIGACIGNMAGGEIIAINPDGTEKWRKKIADNCVDSSPSIAEDGTVYIGSIYKTDRGYIHAFGPQETNEPPESPTISGETIGKIGIEYWYSFSAVDPDNNPISYYIDWDDGTSGWVGTRASGELCYFSHTWATQGVYTIKAKVKDVFDEESEWATFDVKIERKSREVQQMLFYRFLEQFPILRLLLSLIRV